MDAADGSFRREVFLAVQQSLTGHAIDSDRPRVQVTEVVDETPSHYALVLSTTFRVDDGEPATKTFWWTDWEPYADQSAASMAAGLAQLIRIELRELADTS
jgi:hypothetical protein